MAQTPTDDKSGPRKRLFNGNQPSHLTHDAIADCLTIAINGISSQVMMNCNIQAINQSGTRELILSESRSASALEEACAIWLRIATRRRRRNPKSDWLQILKERHEHYKVDPRLNLCGSLQVEDRQIERFVFWRDRLVVLKQAFDDATPKTISQWWHDRRNSVRWYTFWVAVLVFLVTTFLGAIQSIEGALQVYVSYKTAG
jgi:hypothetical protein